MRPRIIAEKEGGVVVYQFRLYAYLTPPIANEGLGSLPDGISRGLVDDPQRNAIVLADAVAVGIADAVAVQQAVCACDVLGQASIVGGRSVIRRPRDDIAGGPCCKAVELLRDEAAIDSH